MRNTYGLLYSRVRLAVDTLATYKFYRCMTKKPPPPPPKPPHAGKLIAIIRRLAKESKIAWTDHAFDERMNERNFDISDVLEIFRLGDIDGKIEQGANVGEWRCVVVGNLKWTTREAGVVTVVVRDERLIVVTVEWMDP